MKRIILVLAAAGVLAASCKGGPQQEPAVKNVIFMIGDGMGLAHVTATMIGQGYDNPMALERAEAVGLVKTYSANNRVTDSGASASAYATGFKCRNSTLSVDLSGAPLETIAEKAHAAGMGTGLAVVCAMNHATPSAFYAHTGNRRDYGGVTRQLLDTFVDVMLGGGPRRDKNTADTMDYVAAFSRRGYTAVSALEALDTVHCGRVAGFFADGHMPMITGRWVTPGNGRDSLYLGKATRKALDILSHDFADKGFFLLVEGSMIDYAAHDNDIESIRAEVRDFDRAVAEAFDFADTHPGTLVVVTADHETGGLSIPSGDSDYNKAEAGLRFAYGSDSHTASMVPLYAYGSGAERFGRVLENTEVNRLMREYLGL